MKKFSRSDPDYRDLALAEGCRLAGLPVPADIAGLPIVDRALLVNKIEAAGVRFSLDRNTMAVAE